LTPRKFHEIWIEQCAAAEDIKLRYGLTAAFDYLVAEKLMNFADAALRHPRFARELPRFVSRVRHLFTPQEIRTHLARIERERRGYGSEIEKDDALDKEDEPIREGPAATAERARRFAVIRELLTAAELGTS
jgi:hypothetical protein